MVPIAAYYLGAPSVPQPSSGSNRHQSMSQTSLSQSPKSSNSSSLQKHTSAANRASMPTPSRSSISSHPHPTVGVASSSVKFEAPQEADETAFSNDNRQQQHSPLAASPSSPSSSPPSPQNSSSEAPRRSGSMKRNWKFPTLASSDNGSPKLPEVDGQKNKGHFKAQESLISPSSIEVPPPPPVEKERPTNTIDDGEDEVGDTVEVPLN